MIRLRIISLIGLIAFSGVSLTVTQNAIGKEISSEEITGDIKQLSVDVKSFTRDLDIVRRDQLNYKIEKDLLKEAYSSNLQSINIIITIVFGVFGLLGYLGLKSIKEIKTDYEAELEKLRMLKDQFEEELRSLRRKQIEFEDKVVDLAKTNEDQDRRLKVMELIEKVSGLIKSKQWEWALKHISIGLSIDQENTILLKQKAICHGRLGELADAIAVSKELLTIEPKDKTVAINMLEYMALANNGEEFNIFYNQYKADVDHASNGALTIYLKSILAIMQLKMHDAKAMLTTYVANQMPDAKEHIEAGWSFDDALVAIDRIPQGDQKRLLTAVVNYFRGAMKREEFGDILQKDNRSQVV